ncbi:hypothetical protein D1816_13165 [Aquimarina sp. AD10]|uniref:hypothetical protein n=1 Tax=Aquimarina sp. AD10 TaxID=1714849 RepID=UPI000E4CCCE1|nr:hypothetical protein [Aquimarina sp. AD10]AXT61255.1 hypothetical protein D1816_13165 [Aquimarina sp. AD10]RKN02128.1 hypothetical protein D7033_01440 [Aquimarina sp. AD10]
MGGYGHNLSNLLKNSRRKERKAYDGWTESDEESHGIKVESVSEEKLQEIRDKLKKQRQSLFRKRLIGFCIVIISIIGAIIYASI